MWNSRNPDPQHGVNKELMCTGISQTRYHPYVIWKLNYFTNLFADLFFFIFIFFFLMTLKEIVISRSQECSELKKKNR